MILTERVISGISRRRAMAAAAISATGLFGAAAAATPPARAEVTVERKRAPKPTVWKAKFANTRVERHPNGRKGEYLAHLTGGSGSGRCRHSNNVRKIDHDDLSRCIQRDERDLSDGHVAVSVAGKSYQLLDHTWDDGTGELQVHLRVDHGATATADDEVSADTYNGGCPYVSACSCSSGCYCAEGYSYYPTYTCIKYACVCPE